MSTNGSGSDKGGKVDIRWLGIVLTILAGLIGYIIGTGGFSHSSTSESDQAPEVISGPPA